ncbi:hypothetical protein GCM10023210_10130 [Chryseobacterium ginsengisoli]|uniref:YCII-related domain-containing protein n=1 Tax=Chryseobacterium ginsengisoli TaxID=363853 RepID=A0ABP9M0L5_9FLAO
MNICPIQYKEPHLVILIFKQLNGFNLKSHEEYYKGLKGSVEMMQYGEVMNDNAVCTILRSSEADALEKIIENDPSIQSGTCDLQQIIPLTI